MELEWLKPRQLSQLDWKNTTQFQSRTQIAEKSAMAKTLKRITLLMSAQGFGPSAAEAVGTYNMQQCPSGSNNEAVERYEGFWMWIAIFALLVLWFLSAYMACFAWKKLQGNMNEYVERLDKAEWDIYHCWNQVADEDNYIAQQSGRIDGIDKQLMMLDGRLTEASNEASMNHDYTVRLHYSIVEFGGFLRFPFGVEPDQLVSMCVQERANLVAHNAMCSGQYLNLVRLRAFVEGGETTDVVMERNQNMGETAESEELSDDELTPARALENPSVTTLMEELKIEHRLALQREKIEMPVAFSF